MIGGNGWMGMPHPHAAAASSSRSGRTLSLAAAAAIESSAALATGEQPRLPSTRPIDHRWDKSRGIILRTAKRATVLDHTWSFTDGIVFAQPLATRRTFSNTRRECAKREIGLPPNPNNKSTSAPTPSVKSEKSTFLADSTTGGKGFRGTNKEVAELKHERSIKDAKIVELESKVSKLNAKNENDGTEARSKLQKAKDEHEAERKRLETLLADTKKQLAEERGRNDREIQKEKKIFKQKVADLETAQAQKLRQIAQDADPERRQNQEVLDSERSKGYDDGYREGERVVYEILETEKGRNRDVETDLRKKVDEAEQSIVKQMGGEALLRRVLEDQQRDLGETSKQLALFTQRAGGAEKRVADLEAESDRRQKRGESHRKDYPAYRSLWKDFNQIVYGEVLPAARDVRRDLNVEEGLWHKSRKAFESSTALLLFHQSGKYTALRKSIIDYLDSKMQEVEEAEKALDGLGDEVSDQMAALRMSSHYSRELTRYHHFGNAETVFTSTDLAESIANVAPFREQSLNASRVREHLERKKAQATSFSERADLHNRLDEAKREQFFWQRTRDITEDLRRLRAFEALLHDSPVEKRVHLETYDLEQQIRLAGEGMEEGDEGATDRSWLAQFRRQQTVAFEKLRGYAQFVRMKSLLEWDLGKLDEGQIAQYDVNIRQHIENRKRAITNNVARLLAEFPRTRTAASTAYSAPVAMSSLIGSLRYYKYGTSKTTPSAASPKELTQSMLQRKIPEWREILRTLRAKRDSIACETPADEDKDSHDFRLRNVEVNIRGVEGKLRKYGGNPEADGRSSKHAATDRADKGTHGERSDDSRTLAEVPSPEAATTNNQTASEQESPPKDGEKPQNVQSRDLADTNGAKANVQRANATEGRSNATHRERRIARVAPKPMVQSEGLESLRATLGACIGLNLKQTEARKAVHASLPYDSLWCLDNGTRDYNNASVPIEVFSTLPGPSRNPVAFQTTSSTTQCSSMAQSDVSANLVSEVDALSLADVQHSTSSASGSEGLQPATAQVLGGDGEHEKPEAASDPVAAATVVEQAKTLDYEIPAKDYRAAVMASPNTNAAFWSYTLYKGKEGKKPTVYYCTDFSKAEERAKLFVDEPVLGFDLEWEVGASLRSDPVDIKRNISLVQLASEDKIGLFHVALFKGSTLAELLPPTLRQILESPDIAKTGVNVGGDARRAKACMGVDMQGVFELSRLYKVVKLSAKQPNRVNFGLVSLASQVAEVLLLPLKKDSTRTSAWSRRLNTQQTDYAASDAYAGFHLYHKLENERIGMNPRPPRPAFIELDRPLVLGNGEKIYKSQRKTYPAAKKVAATEGATEVAADDGEAEEEFFDAVEELDPYELDSADKSAELATDTAQAPFVGQINYPTLPPLDSSPEPDATGVEASEAVAETDLTVKATTQPEESSAAPKAVRPETEQTRRADAWEANWRASLPPDYNVVGRPRELKAWHLWHEQGHSMEEVAAFLKDPPLVITTVASYIVQSIKTENLPYDEQRVKEVLQILPPVARARYWKIVKDVED